MKKITAILRRLHQLHAQLARLGPMMRGSVVRLGPYKKIFFSLNKNHQTRLVYLGRDREQAAKTCSDNYWKLLEIVEEMTLLNLELLKQHADPLKLAAEKTGCLKKQNKNLGS